MNNNDFIEELRLDREQLAARETFIEKKQREYCIDRNIDYPDPEYLMEIGGVPTLPKGNLAALSAKWKNGKTFFCDILSAVFLGANGFGGLRSLKPIGKVQFFDTEQAVSDTARILKIINSMISEQRHDDIKVYCLRNACIENMDNNSEEISRLDFISQTIASGHPDLVIIDGIADLIYNYNDVIESQDVVNKLAALANEHNCCIVTVMHQNKSKQDKSMKGHLGTMLFQKCSDVFSVEKVSSLFIVTHQVSRHRQCDDFVFKIGIDGVPVDAADDRQQAEELKKQGEQQQLIATMRQVMENGVRECQRKYIVKHMVEQGMCKSSKAYQFVNEAIEQNILVSENGVTYRLSPQYCDSNTPL